MDIHWKNICGILLKTIFYVTVIGPINVELDKTYGIQQRIIVLHSEKNSKGFTKIGTEKF